VQRATPVQVSFSHRCAILVAGLVLFGVCFWAFSQNNQFPAEYHPDEPGKGLQIQQGRRNYRHPQVLLELSTLALWSSDARTPLGKKVDADDPAARLPIQRAVEVGRDVSAGLAAAAVTAFFWLAWRASGWAAAVLVAALLATCPTLLINAHFMKEDTALVFGLAVLLSAIYYAWQRRDAEMRLRVRAAWALGAAFCLAASGKYVGFITVVPAVWVLFRLRGAATADDSAMPRLSRRRLVGVFLLAATLTSFVINWRVFKNPGTWIEALGNQVIDGVVEHGGLTMAKPNTYYLRTIWEVLPITVTLLAAAAAIYGIVAWLRRGDRWWAVVGLMPLGYLAMLSFASAPNHRHALPVIVLSMFAASLLAPTAPLAAVRRPAVVGVLAVAAAVCWTVWQWPTVAAVNRQFDNDSRAQAAAWLATRVTPDDVILQDALDLDHDPALVGPHRPTILHYEMACEIGAFEAARKTGVTYVVTSNLSYGRYFEPQVVPTPEFRAEYDRRRAWYARLFREGQLLWSAVPVVPTNAPSYPEVRIYRLPAN
jgi:hypothetical protein